MGLFKIDPKGSLEHDLRKIDKQYIPRILDAIESLAENPFPVQSRKMKKSKAIMASIEIKKNDDGFLARIPGIQGAFAEGDTVEEAVFNCIDVVKMIFDYRKERNESLGF